MGPSEVASIPPGREKKAIMGVGSGREEGRDLGGKGDKEEGKMIRYWVGEKD